MPTLTISALYDYFESFSRELKAINHIDDGAKPSFMDDEEFVEKKDNVKYPCMVLDIPDITPVDEGSEIIKTILIAVLPYFMSLMKKVGMPTCAKHWIIAAQYYGL